MGLYAVVSSKSLTSNHRMSALPEKPCHASVSAMLSLLQIRNFAIIDDLEIELESRFTAITGETGAGKSILVDALGLLLGSRADSTAIRAGCDKAELSAEFQLGAESPALHWLQEAQLNQDHACLLRRVMGANGRSRAWINGTAATLAQMQELGELLVEIHGQNEHIRLTRNAEAFALLDGKGEYAAELDSLGVAFIAWQQTARELEELSGEAPLSAAELDLLSFQAEELENSVISADAWIKLEKEHTLLLRGSDVVARVQAALDVLQADDHASGPVLQALANRLQQDADNDRDIANAYKALSEAAINCEEARQSLESALSRIDLSAERLVQLDEQISRLHALARKHRSEPLNLGTVLQNLQARIERAGGLETQRKALQQKHSDHTREYRVAAKALHKARRKSAARLSASVTDLMQLLGMEGGVFELDVSLQAEREPSRRGDDKLEMRVSANPGMPVGPLRKLASGGELSRISLAIKVAGKVAGTAVPSFATQVFDEVDAGIGGDTANAVGRLLQTVAAQGQALCVTHLAQVAVCADQQIRVVKSADEQITRVETALLNKTERVDEIARMLGGKLSDQSRAHASEMLSSALTQH
jgi:DNA repair protein RecN (Recombination protein N)